MIRWMPINARCKQPPHFGVPDHSARLPRFDDRPPEQLAARLRQLKVLQVGTGAVGGGTALQLARLGVGHLALVDLGSFDPQNLLTSPIGPEAVSQPKALVTARYCRQINPGADVTAGVAAAQQLDPADFVQVDLVVLAVDNLPAELAVNDLCVKLGTTLVHAAVSGEQLVAQVRFLANSGGGPCLACGYTRREWELADQQTRFSCTADLLAVSLVPETAGPATRSIGSLCGMAADLAVTLIVRHVLGLGASVLDQEYEYAGFLHRAARTRLVPRAECPLAPHPAWTVKRLDEPLQRYSLGQLAAAVDGRANSDTLNFRVNGHRFITRATCACCGEMDATTGRFAIDGAPATCQCGRRLQLDPLRVYDVVGSNVPWDRPLATLGADLARSVLLSDGQRETLVVGG